METWDALRARRNVRSFTDRPIAEADLERILDAGRRAPSARNLQPWDFVVVTDRAELQELAKVWQSAGHIAGSAATAVLVLRDPADERRAMLDQFDLGQATLAMAVTAADLGIGSGHASVGDQDLARRLLGLPEGRYAAYLLAFGYPADRPLAPIRRPARRPLEDVVHRGKW
ncbi:MAG TPA: nitroreductase family protein [Acidimicrobiales bacterium]|nr:nitroreductase family protein [Acidimicrobiales bacterium]